MLEITDLRSGYGAMQVLRNINLSVAPGEIVLIVGENGAGKSTLLQTVAGLIKPYGGDVRIDGRNVAGLPPDRIVGLGLRLVLDGHQVFPDISVLDNLRIAASVRRISRAEFDADIEEMLTFFPILRDKLRTMARDLSGGQQQMVALAQAFLTKPSVLLCDEPSTGLAMALMPPIIAFLKAWAERGVSVVIVEQHIALALTIADRVVQLDRGAITFEGTPDAFRNRVNKPEPAMSGG